MGPCEESNERRGHVDVLLESDAHDGHVVSLVDSDSEEIACSSHPFAQKNKKYFTSSGPHRDIILIHMCHKF